MTVIIENVIRQTQGRHQIYVFAMSARQLKQLGVISRLHEGTGGVQRRLNEDKSAEIALAMRNPQNSWLDTFLAHMEPDGSWEYENGTIIGDERFRLSIDDGQHRLYALEVLTDEELDALGELTVTAAAGLTFQERLQLFLQQEKRRHIHRNTILQGKNLTGDWASSTEENAYAIVLALANDPRSPLKGKIELEEAIQQRKVGVVHTMVNGTKREPKLLASGLHSLIKAVIGNKSLLYGLSTEKQADIIIRYLSIAANRVWKDKWNCWDDYMLSSSRGVSALLRLFVNSKVFRVILTGNDYGDPRLYSMLILGSQFDWGVAANRLRSDKELVEQLDNRMSRAYSQRTKARERERAKG